MKSWTLRIATIVAVVLGGVIEATAQTGETTRVHRASDPATGAEVRVSQSPAGSIVMEIAAPGVTVTKRASNGTVTTVVRVAKDELTIEASRSAIIVSSGGRKVEATAARLERLGEAQALIARSPAARQAAELLGRISFGQFSPLTLAILSTRNMLLGTAEATAARGELGARIEGMATEPRLMRVSAQQERVQEDAQNSQGTGSSPTDCWNKYVKEALLAWAEYEDCMKNSGFFGDLACALLYDMRAIGAFTWWMKCVAIS